MNRRILLSWFFFHFAALIAVSFHETGRLISLRLTIIPPSIGDSIHRVTSIAEAPLNLYLPKGNLIRQGLVAYLSFAGADAGYGYFAPNIPNSYKLSFELLGADGRTEWLSLRSDSSDLGLRVASLIDQIGGTSSPELREHMLKRLVAVIGRHYPEAKKMRVSLSELISPTLEEYARGKRKRSALLYTHEFSLSGNFPSKK